MPLFCSPPEICHYCLCIQNIYLYLFRHRRAMQLYQEGLDPLSPRLGPSQLEYRICALPLIFRRTFDGYGNLCNVICAVFSPIGRSLQIDGSERPRGLDLVLLDIRC